MTRLQALTVGWIALALGVGCKPSSYREVEVNLVGAGSEGVVLPAAATPKAFRFSVAAMQSPRNTNAAYSRLFSRVGQLLGVPIELVHRRTYGEVNELLLEGKLDAALLCTGGYLALRDREPRAEALAVPVVDGKTTYHAFVIVPAQSAATSLADLRGKRFAFTDELSLSGRAYVLHRLKQAGEEPTRFFGSFIFTHSHDQSIEAVASGIVDGAVVDHLVYERIEGESAPAQARTRVIDRSPPLGMTPVVAAPSLSPEMRVRLREVLLGLDRDPTASAALQVTHIQRFVDPAPGLYDEAAKIIESAR